ncbi:MAG: hypothetical protein ACRBBR_03375 [Cellvibrionaceae bacterium]
MNWHFMDINTLEEKGTGYKIHLLSGTWFHPGKLKPEPPEGIDFPNQLKILRSGLSYIQGIGMGTEELDKNAS